MANTNTKAKTPPATKGGTYKAGSKVTAANIGAALASATPAARRFFNHPLAHCTITPGPTHKAANTHSGARGAYCASIAPYTGAPLAHWLAYLAANGAPALPKSGKPEAISGWVNYLTGVTSHYTLVPPK